MGNKVINTTSVKLGIYEISDDSQLAGMVGDVKEMEDGRKFRLCKNSSNATALAPGQLVQAKVSDDDADNIAIDTASAGATTLGVTNPAGHENLSINELKDGYFCVNDGANEEGHGRKIKANTAADAGDDTTLTFYDALTDLITGSSLGAWIYPIYKDVVLNAGTGKVIGVSICDVTASYYFWVQVLGPCPVLASGAILKADRVEAHDSGAVIAHASSSVQAYVGTAMQAYNSTEYGYIWLNLE